MTDSHISLWLNIIAGVESEIASIRELLEYFDAAMAAYHPTKRVPDPHRQIEIIHRYLVMLIAEKQNTIAEYKKKIEEYQRQ